MDIKFQVALLKQFLKTHPNEAVVESVRYRGDDQFECVEVDHMTDAELEELRSFAEKNKAVPGMEGAASRIASYMNVQRDPAGKKVAKLDLLEQALRLYIRNLDRHWLFMAEDGGFLLPYYVNRIEFNQYNMRSQSPAHVSMSLICFRRGDQQTQIKSWESSDLKGGKTVPELLKDAGLYIPTPETMAGYEKTMARYAQVQPLTGHQYTATGEGEASTDRYSHDAVPMVRDGVPAKLVADDTAEDEDGPKYDKEKPLAPDSFWRKDKDEAENIALPVHPYVRVFDLDRHQFIVLHTDQLTEYKWNPALGDKLILPKAHKDVVQILMDTAAEDIDDIVAGKSGGTIVICTGDPGTGKTLTAEVTSEVIKRPVYKVQCSQLGTNEEAIEKKLTKVLARATRWKALLLIDEADVYVRAREADIQQNAIVGVFLRVLEYYRGVLFLTSNRATVIDDAIMSRATVHLKYEPPCSEDLKRIWRVLSDQFGLDLSNNFIDALARTFPNIVGRDVKSLLKLAIRYSRRQGGNVTIELFKLLSVHKDITPAKL